MLTSSVISSYHLFLCNKEMLKNPKKWWKLMKMANIDIESLNIFWTTWGISMKFSGKIWLMMILKVTNKYGFNLFLGDTFVKKQQVESNWLPPSLFRLKIRKCFKNTDAEQGWKQKKQLDDDKAVTLVAPNKQSNGEILHFNYTIKRFGVQNTEKKLKWNYPGKMAD